MFKKLGIGYSLKTVTDVDDESYCKMAFQAAMLLEEIINKLDKTVFLHCFTSVSRSPTVVMVYFALFCRHPAWSNLDELLSYVRRQYAPATPNMKIVKMLLE